MDGDDGRAVVVDEAVRSDAWEMHAKKGRWGLELQGPSEMMEKRGNGGPPLVLPATTHSMFH